jgi:hypothetical protein
LWRVSVRPEGARRLKSKGGEVDAEAEESALGLEDFEVGEGDLGGGGELGAGDFGLEAVGDPVAEVGGGLEPGEGVFGGEGVVVAEGVGTVDGFEDGQAGGGIGEAGVGAEVVFVEVGHGVAVGIGGEAADGGVGELGGAEVVGLPGGKGQGVGGGRGEGKERGSGEETPRAPARRGREAWVKEAGHKRGTHLLTPLNRHR